MINKLKIETLATSLLSSIQYLQGFRKKKKIKISSYIRYNSKKVIILVENLQ